MTSSTPQTSAGPEKAAGSTPPAGGPPARVPLFSAAAWAPLKVQLFASLYIATSVAQIGTWIREAGGPWLMKMLTDGWKTQPDMIARVLVFSNLPICLFSVFAGALADVLDRRRLLIVTQIWMLVVSALLGILTISGHISPWGLLGLTFLVGTGNAAAGPALQALLPELVPKKDLALAINLNSIALNVARALGPATFIIVISFVHGRAGVGISFLVTAVSFIWAIVVLTRWHRAPQSAGVHGEQMWGAIRSGFQYTVNSPANRAILLRVFTFIVPAVVIWSQVPVIATKNLHLAVEFQEKASALLFAFVGLGAVLGVLLMPGLHGRYKIDPVVNACTALFALGLMILSAVHSLWLACIVMTFLGVNWVIVPTNFNTATQKSVPLWVKGRAISFYLTVLFGSFAVGGAIWGPFTRTHTISTSLFASGVVMAVFLVLAKWFPLTINEGLDLAAAFAGPAPKPVFPDIVPGADPISGPLPAGVGTPPGMDPSVNPSIGGPVQVNLQYDVDPARAEEFLHLMRNVGRVRRRNGAAAWRLEPGSQENGAVTYHEVIRYRTTAEYHRQPARMTKADLQLHEKARALHCGEGELPGHARILMGAEADPLGAWFVVRVAKSFDRFFEEIATLFDRFGALRVRDNTRRKPTYREVRLRLPH